MSLQHHLILKYHPVFSTIRSEVLIQVNPKKLKAKSRTLWTHPMQIRIQSRIHTTEIQSHRQASAPETEPLIA